MSEPVTAAVLDLGSNSLRMTIVRAATGRVHVLKDDKSMVRLGEDVFASGMLQPAPMERTLSVLKEFAGECQFWGVTESIALATAASREAANAPEFFDLVRATTGFSFRIISGEEEARLICLGVSHGLPSIDAPRMFIDIGGGSTEVSVAHNGNLLDSASLPMGAVRLAEMFRRERDGRVSPLQYARMQDFARKLGSAVFGRMEKLAPVELVGSSGTIKALARMTGMATRSGEGKICDAALDYSGLCRTVRELCGKTDDERTCVPGLPANRKGIIVPGAAILQTVMEELCFDSILVSSGGLRDGVLADRFGGLSHPGHPWGTPPLP